MRIIYYEYDNNRIDNYNNTNNDNHYNLLKCDWCISCVIVTNHSVQLSVIGQIHLGQASPVETASKGKDSSIMVIPQ